MPTKDDPGDGCSPGMVRACVRTAVAKSDRIASRAPMRSSLLRSLIRFLTWCCVVLLAFLSLLPAEDMARTGFPGELEHFAAYAGSVAIGMAGYGLNDSRLLVIGSFWLYAGVLEYLQHFSPGRHPAFLDFAASALGALCGGLLWSSSCAGDLACFSTGRSNQGDEYAAQRCYHRAETNDQMPHQRLSETSKMNTNAAPTASLASAPGCTPDADAARLPLPVGAWRPFVVHQRLPVPIFPIKGYPNNGG